MIPAHIDMPRITALLDAAVDILGPKVTEFYRAHGVGSVQLENIIHMNRAALDCLERAAALAEAYEPLCIGLADKASLVRARIADLETEHRAWLEAEATVEAVSQTKH